MGPMTAVVLAGGRGRRLAESDVSTLQTPAQRRAAAGGLKVLMPVDADGSRPLLDYVLSALADGGVTDVVLVVPPEHEGIRAHAERLAPTRVNVSLAVQPEPDGTAGAVLAAAPAVAAPTFLAVNGDNLYPAAAIGALAAIEGCGLGAFTRRSLMSTSHFTAAKVAAFATVECDEERWLTGLTEKPPVDVIERADDETLVSMNLWKFDRTIFEACRDVPRSPRGERELPAAVMLAVSRGTRFRVIEGEGTVLDVTTAGDVSAVSLALSSVEPRP
jgi:dTDP-glucose pyrophosphorylase